MSFNGDKITVPSLLLIQSLSVRVRPNQTHLLTSDVHSYWSILPSLLHPYLTLTRQRFPSKHRPPTHKPNDPIPNSTPSFPRAARTYVQYAHLATTRERRAYRGAIKQCITAAFASSPFDSPLVLLGHVEPAKATMSSGSTAALQEEQQPAPAAAEGEEQQPPPSSSSGGAGGDDGRVGAGTSTEVEAEQRPPPTVRYDTSDGARVF